MIRPFIKWAGGKSRVLPDLLPHLPKADCLIEPFVGGASVFLATEYRCYVLADINPDLINLYRCLTSYTDLVIEAAQEIFENFNDAEGYGKIRTAFNTQRRSASKCSHTLENIGRAVRFIYLNRHCCNGVCRYSKKTGFNVPFGKYKSVYFADNEIRLFAEKANDTKAIFLCAPFERSLQVVTGGDVLVYCDPPYLPESKTADFTQYCTELFTEDNHRQLVQALLEVNRKHGVKVVISNSDTETTREIYHRFRLHDIDVQRSVSTDASNSQKAKEVIGVLKVFEGCGRAGGGRCPDCGPCAGYSMWGEAVGEEPF
ncbi:Dam family site-specific DNA-(adenine-N6)-methyltransferase [Serratia symbiotica]|uniref:DNA adenine methylase n=1 Tax=Serratia symbiotica TaxID=138074 RepID=UPI001D7E710C|nr:Dam family site-specific DNA-(adenine-N6)-methyltransferase [Serratia symbiotica]NIG88180.1 Dam family site-specific DNA-(adenine-N6)-methyltransferase [Serratia symbiotica]USS96288.1 Dam family site-specific DNA-(adenine-N6)-methyltransferase [Serratia symbiotica]